MPMPPMWIEHVLLPPHPGGGVPAAAVATVGSLRAAAKLAPACTMGRAAAAQQEAVEEGSSSGGAASPLPPKGIAQSMAPRLIVAAPTIGASSQLISKTM